MGAPVKGKIAVALLVLMLGGFGAAFSRPGRASYWTARMRSADIETRKIARLRLLELGRPWTDGVLAEIVGAEVAERTAVSAHVDSSAKFVAFVGRVSHMRSGSAVARSFIVEGGGPDRIGRETWTNIHESRPPDLTWSLLEAKADEGRRVLVVARDDHDEAHWMYWELLVVSLPENVGLAQQVIDAAKARLAR
jgi:hypothetical protein